MSIVVLDDKFARNARSAELTAFELSGAGLFLGIGPVTKCKSTFGVCAGFSAGAAAGLIGSGVKNFSTRSASVGVGTGAGAG
jgi:hypothetical protein